MQKDCRGHFRDDGMVRVKPLATGTRNIKNLTSILRAAAVVSMTGDTQPTRLDTTPEQASLFSCFFYFR